MIKIYRIISFFIIFYLSGLPVFAQSNLGYSRNSPTIMGLKGGANKSNVKSFGSSSNPSSQGMPDIMSQMNPQMAPLQTGATQAPQAFYSIHILGEVTNPGTYKIIPSDRVSDALKYAGGVLPNGSERTIQLRRGDQSQTLDMFAYKYRGSLQNNPYLMENDVVFVSVKKGEFEIEGPVNRPGNYEMTRKISLIEAINMAGGFASGVSRQDTIRVVRFGAEEKKEILEVSSSKQDLSKFTIQKGDVIVIPHVLLKSNTFDYTLNRIPGDNIFYPTVDDNVYVMGAVLQPGAFPFQPNYSYKEYVSLAGATQHSKMKRIKLIKKNGEQVKLSVNTVINPGDTILVPQKYWRAETVASWLSTVASLTLSSLIITDRLQK